MFSLIGMSMLAPDWTGKKLLFFSPIGELLFFLSTFLRDFSLLVPGYPAGPDSLEMKMSFKIRILA